ncbi:MAG: 2Fe-2S iron-sulfur cluster binding domain-containing protein, partial [Clostridia bacterium]|nr:2Fe-2S iron-sulfur cluster binding domain-containing protein [Clostridia bacterium]
MKQEKIVIPASAVGMPLLTFLAECGVFLSADCGGKGTCGKCRVKLLEGSLSQLSSPDSPLAPDADGTLLACQVRASAEGAVILLSATKGQGLTNTALGAQTGALLADEEWGIALDIGTTTLAMAGVGLTSKRISATTSRLNPQKNFGADVMSRISASINGQLDALCRVVMTATKEMIEELKQNAHKQATVRMTVVGNPTMLHLFCGISPEGMCKSPFTP